MATTTTTTTNRVNTYKYNKPAIIDDENGYTGYAWRGRNCPRGRHLSVKEVAQYIREYIKSEPDLNACKWSITTKIYSGGQSLTVALMAAPFEAIREEWEQQYTYEAEHNHTQHADCAEAVTPEAFALVQKVKAFALSFNRDDSDGMIDYFARGFYDWYHVGKWDKPFQLITAKAEPEATEQPAAVEAVNADGVQIVDYSEKAIVVVGNTQHIAEQLKAIGGRFNRRLRCGAGWIFSKKKENEVRALLGFDKPTPEPTDAPIGRTGNLPK